MVSGPPALRLSGMRTIILFVVSCVALLSRAVVVDAAAREVGVVDRCALSRSFADPPAGVALATRPAGTGSLTSEHFVVHFQDEQLDAYARDVIDAAEYSYRILIDTLEYRVPPSDAPAGGDARIDIYIRPAIELGGAYGTTIPDAHIAAPYFNAYSSWIELSDALDERFRLTVTAHEVYHVVQVGYDRRESLSLLEMYSTWFEDRAYDAFNSHYIFLLQFFRRPDRGLFEQSYTNVPWAIFLTERHGDDVMRAVLERAGQTPGPNPRGAFDGALQSLYNTTFADEFVEFGTWNYFTSLRDDGAHYAEGAHYPAMRCQIATTCYPVTRPSDHTPSELGANYFLLDGNGHHGRMHVRVEPDPLATAYLTVIRFAGRDRERSVTHYAAGAKADSFVVDGWEDCDSLLLIYQVDRGHPTDNLITVRARYEVEATPATPWFLVLDRDGCRRPFDGVGDEFMARDGEETPIARALRENGVDVVVSEEVPPDLNGCAGIFVVAGYGDDGPTLSASEIQTLAYFMDDGGDVYLESARLGEWVDSSSQKGNPALPAFWKMFGTGFVAGRDSSNVATWSIERRNGHDTFRYDTGEPDFRVGELRPETAAPLAVDERGRVRATVWNAGESSRIVSTVLLGASTGIAGATRADYIADVLARFEATPPARPAPTPSLRVVASYPNPARDRAELWVEAPSEGVASIAVYDVAGRRVATTRAPVVAGNNRLGIATPRASGHYFVVVEAAGQRARARLLVLR